MSGVRGSGIAADSPSAHAGGSGIQSLGDSLAAIHRFVVSALESALLPLEHGSSFRHDSSGDGAPRG